MSLQKAWYRLIILALLPMTLWLWSESVGWPNSVHAQEGEATAKTGEIVVKLNPAANVTIDDINATYGTVTLKMLLRLTGIYLLQTPPGQEAHDVVDAMETDTRLLFAELNFIYGAPEANPRRSGGWGGQDNTPYPQQYAVELLNLAQAQAINRGAGTVVAVLDTGVQLDHPALAASLTGSGYDFVDDDSTPNDEFGGVDDNGNLLHPEELGGHGTHVAGIIHLVAPEAKIMPLRVLDRNGFGNVFTLAEAIIYAVEHDAHVLNLSLGQPEKSELLKEAIREATLNSAVVVAAAGNLNSEAEQYPGATRCALSITSVGPERKKSDFANYGDWIAFAAPGEGIYSTFAASGYATWSGTSMATPFGAGQAALIHSAAPSLNARQVAMLIGGTGQSLDEANPDFKGRLGRGLIDIGASLERLQSGDLPDKGQGLMGESCVTNNVD